MMNRIFFLKLILAIAFSELAGILGSFFTIPAISGWYQELIKPEFSPPNSVFAPVWTILFLMMGIASFLVWQKGFNKKNVKVALIVFLGQLALNIFWSIVFFGWRNPGGAFIEIVFLWLAIAATIFYFARVSRASAWLLLPYIIWVSFAGYLNFQIWMLNG